jgi:SAM-dependent methyltransferase
MTTQNIYDNPDFFAGYSRLGRSVQGLEGAPEWPALQAMLPPLAGARVLDLGCGFGWFCRWVRQHGAAKVLGIDVSENMLARAREMTQDAAVTYQRGDLEQPDYAAGAYDLVYSSLTLHYIVGLDGLVEAIARALVPGGRLVFSAEHPMFTAPSAPGWRQDEAGHKTWPVDQYLLEGPRSTDWLAKSVIKQHRTMASYLMLLLRAGFCIAHVEEWGPTEAQIAARPEWAAERERPPFLLVGAEKG